MGPLRQGVKVYLLHRVGRVFRLYYDIYRYNYRLSTGIDDLRVARARELPQYLSIPRLCQFL